MRRTTRGARAAAVLLLVAAALHGAADETPDARQPVPDAALRSTAASELKKELGEKLRTKDAEAKRALARTLLERAAAAEADAAKRYALLDAAESLAEDVRDVGLALDAAGRMSAAFQVEGAARAFAAVDAIGRAAKEPIVLADVATACVDISGDALAADDAPTAGKALAAAKTLAKSAKLGGLAARAAELETFVAAFRRQSVAAETARATLATAPDDPAAHETIGRFLAFGRGRWDEGLAHLAKSPNAVLADLAAKDAAHPGDAAARRAVADGWWELAQKEKDLLARARMLARAAAAYETATDADPQRAAQAKERLEAITWSPWARGVAVIRDFSNDGPVALALATIRDFIAKQHVDRRAGDWRSKVPRFPDVAFGRGDAFLWRLDTNQGAITLRLFQDTAPKHVANIVYLTELGFFDGANFHRVIPGFMAQGGSVCGYTFATEFIGDRKHDRAGVLSMANTGLPNSDSSQFFITFAAAPHLDGKHTIFGEVADGMDVVRKLETQGTPDPGTPKTPLVIETARIVVR